MKLLVIIFIMIMFPVLVAVYNNEQTDSTPIVFPTLDTPDLDFVDLSGGCGFFLDCIEYLANVIFNFVLGLIFLVVLIIDVVIFIVELLVLLIDLQFSGIDGAPFYINAALIMVPIAGAISIYLMIRSGKSEA